MNGEIPSIPIITLAGVSSLTNLLPELPLPTPLPQTINKTLLYRPRLAADAQQLLLSRNDALVNQLVSALRMTNSDHIEPSDSLSSEIVNGESPDLLKAILASDPDVFKSGSVYRNPGYGFLPHNELYANQMSSMQEYQQQQPQPPPLQQQMMPNGPSSVLPPYLANQPAFTHSQAPTPLAPSQGYPFVMNGIGSSLPLQPSEMAVVSSSGTLLGLSSHPFSSVPGTRPMSGGMHDFSNPSTVGGGGGIGDGVKVENFCGASGGVGRMPGKALIDCSPAQATAAPASASEPPLRGVLSSPHYDPYIQAVKPDSLPPSKASLHFPDPTAARVMIEPLNMDQLEKCLSSKKPMAKKPVVGPVLIPTIPLTRIDDIDRKKHKHRDGIARYNVVQTTADSHKLTLKLSKAKHEERRGTKRIHSDDEDYGEVTMAKMEEEHGEFATSLTERVKCRRKAVSYREDDSDEDGDYDDDGSVVVVADNNHAGTEFPGRRTETSSMPRRRDFSRIDDDSRSSSSVNEAMRRRKKERKQRRYMEMSSTVEELMETPTFKRFYSAVDTILDAADDMDLAGIRDEEEEEGPGEVECVVSKAQVLDLCSEAAKLKSMGIMNQVPCEKLIKTLTILQYSIQDGCRLVPVADPEGENEEEQLLRELTLDRVLLAVDAALSAMYVMTSSDMPKEVFLEDVIERIIRLTKTQLQNAIYPEFDPVYRIDPHNKSGIQSNMKMKRAKASGTKDRTTLALYNKLTDLTALIAELVDIQELTDTIILQTSTLAVSPFFVENIQELQLNALKLVTNIFSRYEKHRQLILEDILSSLARLPSSKKNLRSYRLNADDHIQMVTALALQLIQCVVKLPQMDDVQPHTDQHAMEDEVPSKKKKNNDKVDKEVMILTSYETAMRTAHNFLAVFLAKCTSKGEDDYRSLFENFVYDLLATVNKPEWPASELILSLLGNLLVKQFSSKSVEMSLRVASLDYLGIVASRLRRDAVSSRLNEDVIQDIISQINDPDDGLESAKAKSSQAGNGNSQTMSDVQKTEVLQKSLLEYLVYGSEHDPALMFARQFYIAQWYRDCTMEVEKASKKLAEEKRNDQKRRRKKVESEEEDDDDEESGKAPGKTAMTELEMVKSIQAKVEIRKGFLLNQVATKVGNFATFKPSPSKLNYENVLLITRYLASNRPFSQSFDIYLTQILKVLNETAVAVRTKALKCLTAVIEADPAILARMDMQNGVHGRFLDQSTSVREAAIELVGKFVLIRPELTAQYYDMLSERILDTGISVRKRVIKIFRDICLEQADFPKIPEMCVKMIRRVNDEEGIRKLVNETFQSMWFTPVRDKDTSRLLTRVMNITDVVAACRESGYDWLEQLMDNLLKKEEDAKEKPVEKACIQIVNCLVENVLQLEEKAAEVGRASNSRLVACFSTLYLFCKVKPELLVPHCIIIQPYLDIKCTGQSDLLLLNNVARILELAVPLMDHPSESFLAQLEEDMMKLILKHGMMIVQSCVSCLGAVVKDVTHNFKLVRDCFQRFFGLLSNFKSEKYADLKSSLFLSSRPTLLRALFTVGLLCKHFDLDAEEFGQKEKKVSIREKVFELLLHFLNHSDEEVKHKALTGIGFFVTRNYEFMLGKQLRDVYQELLTSNEVPVKMRCQVLLNLKTYLIEEEAKMMKADADWRKVHDKEDLKELGDVQSGMASTIIQVYIRQVLESFFHANAQVRLSALEVIILILRQGLVHPVQCMPYLICMGSDIDNNIRLKADQQLQEIDKKYPGFIQMKAMQGVKMSYRLQELLQRSATAAAAAASTASPSPACILLRGVRLEDSNYVSLNSYIYSLIRSNRGQRRALLTTALNMFDDTAKTPLSELIYMADNLAYFPYQQQDEPLFIIHQIDIIVSVSGSNLIQSFREVFYPGSIVEGPSGSEVQENHQPDEDDEDVDTLLRLMPEDVVPVQDLFLASQGCILLLVLKQHLKDMYSFTDNKIQRYSLTDTKTFDKPVNRKTGVTFNPKQALDLVRHGPLPTELDEDGRRELLQLYLDFKELMLSIDRDENDDDDDRPNGPLTQGALALTANATGGDQTEAADATASTSTPCPVTGMIGRTTTSSIHTSRLKNTSLHKLSSSEKRRGRPPASSASSRPRPSKPPKHKRKKRRYNVSDSEADSDDGDSDPDWG